jgi:hypothetical protein
MQILQMLGTLHGWSLKNQDITRKYVEPMDIMKLMFSDPEAIKLEKFIATLKTDPWNKYFSPELIAKIPKVEITLEEASKIPSLNKDYGIPDVMNHGDMHTNNM